MPPPKGSRRGPVKISWGEARKSPQIPHGVWIVPKIYGSMGKTRIVVGKDGVRVPRYPKEYEHGRLREVTFKDLYGAIRAEWHKEESVVNERDALKEVGKTLSSVRDKVGDSGKLTTEDLGKLNAARAILVGDSKIHGGVSGEKLVAATELDSILSDKKKSPTAIINLLTGSQEEIRGRRNALKGQAKQIPRRRAALIKRKAEHDYRVHRLVDSLSEAYALTGDGVEGSGLEAAKKLLEDEANKNRYSQSPSIRGTRDYIKKAQMSINAGDITKSREHIKQANRYALSTAAAHIWLNPLRLEQVAKHPDPKFKEKIAKKQAKVYSENLEYWHSPKSHEEFTADHLASNLNLLGAILPKSEFEKNMTIAASKIQEGDVKGAKNLVISAGKTLNAKK